MEQNSLSIALKQAYQEIEKIHTAFASVDQKVLDISKHVRTIPELESSRLSSKEVNRRLEKTVENTRSLNKLTNEQEKLSRNLVVQIAKKEAALSKHNKELQKQRLETSLINKQAKEEAILTSKLTTEYQKLDVKLKQMVTQYKHLAAKKIQDKKLTQQEENQYKRLEVQIRKTDNALKTIDTSIGQNFRRVGSYKNAISGLGTSFRSLLSAFGLTSGVFIFANAVKDAFTRVREFDKSMQNLAGVMRTTRSEIKDLEDTIISVAGVTIRTSNEVAQLAENLATLGKTKDEIKDLLKPVIDLSLGLDAPADEAGEFLIQMLNTFGESTDSAVEFADTIATIRTSTTLDFQKMRDSFQYIAPISRILNQDLAYTGAVVGILADNGLKAEQAGRLLSTAQIKLATANKTLPQALEEINQLYQEGATDLEILAKAGDLFGKQATKVGAILALNKDIIESNAQAIRDNGGALKDLTDRQLESLDAKLKILDSTYESFILNLDNGNNVLGKVTKGAIESLTKQIKILEFGLNNASTAFKGVFGVLTGNVALIGEANDEIEELGRTLSKTTIEIIKQNQAFIDQYGSLAPLTEEQQKLIDNQEKINSLFGGKGLTPFADEKEPDTIKKLKEEIRDLESALDDLETTDEEGIETTQRLIKAKKEQLDAILGLNKKYKEQEIVVKGSIKYFEKQIEELKKLRDGTKLTKEEYDDFNEQIKIIQFNIDELTGAYDEFLDSLTQPIPTPGFDELFKKEEIPSIGFINIDEELLLDEEEEYLKKSFELNEQYIAKRENLYNTLQQSAFTAINSIFRAEVDKYDDLINANSEYYDRLLDNEEISDKTKQGLEEERNKKESELQKKKEEVEKKAFLFGQLKALADVTIDTLRSVALIKSQAAILLSNPITAPLAPQALAQIPLVLGTGAAAAGAIVATSIPQFKEGHLEGNYEGFALINDAKGDKYQEIVERRNGLLQMFTERNQIIEMKKGDRVHKADTFEPSKLLQNSIALSYLDQEKRIALSQEKLIDTNKHISNKIVKHFENAVKKIPKASFNGPTAKEIGRETAKAILSEMELYKG